MRIAAARIPRSAGVAVPAGAPVPEECGPAEVAEPVESGEEGFPESDGVVSSGDYWLEDAETWTRVHVIPRTDYFSVGGAPDGPLPEDVESARVTEIFELGSKPEDLS